MKPYSILMTFILVSSSLIFVACTTPIEQPDKEEIASTNAGQTNQSIVDKSQSSLKQKNTVQQPKPANTAEAEQAQSQGQTSHPSMTMSAFMAPKRDVRGDQIKSRAKLGKTLKSERFEFHSLLPQSSVAINSLQEQIRIPSEPVNREHYQHFKSNPVKLVKEDPLSTFSIDVDTASYTNVRRMIQDGAIPPTDAVRIEEFINYFSYDYPKPAKDGHPFSVTTELGPSPWSSDRYLMQIGLQGYEVPEADRPPVNLVFLIDVSGSMNTANKLPLLKKSFKFLVNKLRPEDYVSMVVYAGASGVVLPPTAGSEKATILNALNQLKAGGSTNGASGIRLAYQTAMQNYRKEASNLVLLATDGDFNVGTTNFNQLIDLIKEKRKSGIAISTLGFGAGNYNDHLAEQIADAGNGSASYIDSLQEARKVLVDRVGAALTPIARDTKIQIEFNPDWVAEYRLIGYENRHLEHHEFNMDSVDAGDLFSGHTVTAIYEIVLVGQSKPSIDPLRYDSTDVSEKSKGQELAFVKLRYKPIGENTSQLLTHSIAANSVIQAFDKTSTRFQFASSVAGYGQLLRKSPYLHQMTAPQLAKIARLAKGEDQQGYRSGFIDLVELTAVLHAEAENQTIDNDTALSQR